MNAVNELITPAVVCEKIDKWATKIGYIEDSRGPYKTGGVNSLFDYGDIKECVKSWHDRMVFAEQGLEGRCVAGDPGGLAIDPDEDSGVETVGPSGNDGLEQPLGWEQYRDIIRSNKIKSDMGLRKKEFEIKGLQETITVLEAKLAGRASKGDGYSDC